MNLPTREIERRLVSGVLDALHGLPMTELSSVQPVLDSKRVMDADIQLTINGVPLHLAIEVRASGYPRDVELAVGRLLASLEAHQHDFTPMLVAPYLTDRSRAVLRRRNVGYWDETGSLYLSAPGVHVLIDRPPLAQRRASEARLFRGAAEQVIHALLDDWRREWTVTGLATASGVAASYAQRVLAQLDERGFVATVGKGPSRRRRVTEPGPLLDEWSFRFKLDRYRARRLFHYDPTDRPISTVASDTLRQAGLPHALTATSGAMRRAPFVVREAVAVILTPNAPGYVEALTERGATEVDDGENILLLQTADRSPLMFVQHDDGTPIASDIQLYLDLNAWPQRGREQAEHLRRVRPGF